VELVAEHMVGQLELLKAQTVDQLILVLEQIVGLLELRLMVYTVDQLKLAVERKLLWLMVVHSMDHLK